MTKYTHRMSLFVLAWCLLLSAPECPGAGSAGFTWEETPVSVSLLNQGRMVWKHVHDPAIGKPYIRFGLPDGTELTRPVPIPEGYAKADHVWHLGLWWAWKYINGVNFWEENHKGTEPMKVEVETHDDGSALITQHIAYHLENKPALLHEKRVVSVSAPDKNNSYHIDWTATFSPAGTEAVVLNKNSYGGFALRAAAEFCGDEENSLPAWTFSDDQGRVNESNGKAAKWVAFSGTAQNGKPAGLVIMDHPDNPRHPIFWQTRAHYPFLNPSFTCKEDYTLNPREQLKLKYRVLVMDGETDKARLEQAWNAFAPNPE